MMSRPVLVESQFESDGRLIYQGRIIGDPLRCYRRHCRFDPCPWCSLDPMVYLARTAPSQGAKSSSTLDGVAKVLFGQMVGRCTFNAETRVRSSYRARMHERARAQLDASWPSKPVFAGSSPVGRATFCCRSLMERHLATNEASMQVRFLPAVRNGSGAGRSCVS